ncbi:hypothetical protein HOLleu_28945 [Holothuria leucospilota]|uniref:Uncharacterized protein n=1 Tax=Holothuria leucospilota TaxID=206669 RepID=A0A9Q1BN03_HOLLE|nr:hypothetical protein HOLleu_28945 [Holothuria leucospilota]
MSDKWQHLRVYHQRGLMPQYQKYPLLTGTPIPPTPFSFSTGLALQLKGMPLKRKTKSESGGTEEGEVLFFSKKMKKTLVMPVDGNSSKGQDEGPSHPAILSNLLNAPKTFQTLQHIICFYFHHLRTEVEHLMECQVHQKQHWVLSHLGISQLEDILCQ